MILLDKEQNCLLELVRASLFDIIPVIPDHVDWEKTFELAKSQCIVPLIASFVPEEHRNTWLEISCQSKAHYMRMLFEQNSLCNLFNANSIPFVIFKGTAAAIYYPVPSLRTYGDVDFYVSEHFFDSARNLLEHNCYHYIENNDRHYEYEKNGIVFELHNRISRQSDSNIDDIILNDSHLPVECSLNNYRFPCLPRYENGLVLLWHLMHHLKFSGIGLRQIIDWMMFVHKELDDSAWNEYFQPLAIKAGFDKLAITVTFMCKKWLGLSDNISWCNDADEELADHLLMRIFYDGNFGGERILSDSIKIAIRNEGLFRFLQRAGMANWTLAKKYVVFKPFAWLYQLCRFARKGISHMLNGEKVFVKDDHYMSLEELWKRFE